MSYREAARELSDRLADTAVPWAVTASANLALRGFDVEPGDVDVMTDAAGVERIVEAFSEDVIRPVQPPAEAEHGNIRSHFCALELADIEVELMGDVEHRVDGRWERAQDVASHREFIAVDGRQLPVMTLDHERRAYRALGREDRLTLLAHEAP